MSDVSQHPAFPYLPKSIAPFILGITDVLPDGHCGFRAISVSLGNDQGEWLSIREKMISDVNLRQSLYTNEFMRNTGLENLASCLNRLQTTLPNVVHLREHWLKTPDMGPLIANAFDRPVFIFGVEKNSGEQNVLFLPCFTPPNSSPPIFIAFLRKFSHYVSLSVDWKRSGFPSGRLCAQWKKHHSPCASGWLTWCPQQDTGPEYVYSKEQLDEMALVIPDDE